MIVIMHSYDYILLLLGLQVCGEELWGDFPRIGWFSRTYQNAWKQFPSLDALGAHQYTHFFNKDDGQRKKSER